MSTDHDLDLEQLLAARMGAAAEPVTGSGVTMERVEARVAERRTGRRRRQGLVAVAAAAIVVLGGVGLAAAVGDGDRPSGVVADDGTSTTEAPTTEPPTTDCVVIDAGVMPGTSLPTTTVMSDETETTIPADVEGTGPAVTTAPGTTISEGGQPCPPTTTATVPPSTSTETTAPPTTAPELVPGRPCAPGSSADCIDPEGDGTYVYLIGGADCMANPIGDSGNVYAHCIDLDGDGEAGYGDEGEVGVGGEPCAPGTNPDCIDPEGDGTYVFLIGGGDCMASPIGGPMCADLDGDGHAGYPDQG